VNDKLSTTWERLKRVAIVASRKAHEGLRSIWRLIRGPLIFVLQIFAALIVLFEEWGWKPLSEALARLARYAPIARLERWIASLSPYPALIVFVLPTTFLAPLKLLAVWLLATGKYWTATGLFLAAKVAATALVARLFVLTQPSLMQIEWFARAYNWFVPWKDAFFAIIRASWPWRYGRMLKNRIKHELRRLATRLRPKIRAFIIANDALRSLLDKLPVKWRQFLDAPPEPPPGT
jgi:hypothetical protein